MCKCCQSCLESCYWHCFEKWWCYDDSIALYEDPLAEEKDHRSFDNVAFWDSVAVIANRSVVTIQPLPDRPLNNNNTQQQIIQPIENKTESDDKKKVVGREKDEHENKVQTSDETNETKTVDVCGDAADSQPKTKSRKQSTIEEMIEKQRSGSISQEHRNRKKSLKERRKSAAGLTLKLENDFHEIPVIRQSSMPRFFLDTPEVDNRGSWGSQRSNVLMSPSLGNSPTFNYDLKSIVQIENDIKANQSKPCTPKANKSSRLTQVRKKIKPIIIKKPSSKSLSLPDSINHM